MGNSHAGVSVVIPMFNSAATIKRALDSVACQLMLPRQVIVIDDASTDESCEVVNSWSNPFIAIELITNKTNLGPSISRNIGWDHASEPFVAFLDADDAWHPHKLKMQIEIVEEDPTIFIIGHDYQTGIPSPPNDIQISEPKISMYYLRDFLIKNRLSTPTVMVRRDLQNRFTPDQRHSEDYRLWLEIVACYGSVTFIHSPLTRLFKPEYGVSGLSSEMKAMYLGEIRAICKIREQAIINWLEMCLCVSWLTIKYFRRLAQSFVRDL